MLRSVQTDEDAASALPPKFNTYAKITKVVTKYYSTLCKTEKRWSRLKTGGPKKMEDDSGETL